MSAKRKNLSFYDPDQVPEGFSMHIGIVVSDWNKEITDALLTGAINTLKKHGTPEKNIIVRNCPGTFELPLSAQLMAETAKVDAIICLGCVIQGETKHFDFICQGVTQGIMDLNLKYNLPFIFGILTTSTFEQAKERAGGIHGNKGDEAAITAIKMIDLYNISYSGKKRNHIP